MKPNRDSQALAASLTEKFAQAAAAPLPLPAQAKPAAMVTPITLNMETPVEPKAAAPKMEPKARVKVMADTVQMTLRPGKGLVSKYTNAAADRTRQVGKVVSAQEIMLEVLERGSRSL